MRPPSDGGLKTVLLEYFIVYIFYQHNNVLYTLASKWPIDFRKKVCQKVVISKFCIDMSNSTAINVCMSPGEIE